MTREYTRREVFESVGDVVAQATRIPAQKIANIHLSRRDFIRLSALGLVLARCTTPPSEPTDSPPAQANVPPTLQVEPTPVPIPTPTVYGETIVGSSLEIGGASLELKTRLAQELADLTGAKDRGWLVVADNEGRSSCFIGEADGEQVAVLGQGPSGYEWDGEAGIWKTPDYLNIVVPDVTLPGGWNEETGRAGPRASAEFTFMVEYGDQPKVVVLYSADTIAEMQGSGSSEEQGIEVLSDGSGMWVGESKRVSLDGGQGETVVRDSETGTLSVINNQGGLVRSMVVRWSEAKSPEEALQVGSWVAVVVAVEEAVETPTIEGATILMEVSHTYDEEVMGVPVQFTIGLHPGLVNASEFPIKDVVTNDDVLFPHHITGEQVTARQLWAELVMRSHWKGWQEDDVARGGTTFEEYMELVKQGGGKYMVSGTIDDTSLSFRERDVIQELEVDPQLPITVVLSNRADPLVSFVPESGFRIAQKLNREMIIEYTFKESVRGKYYEDPFMLGYYADAKASGAMQSLSFPPEMQAKNTGLIGGEIAFDPDLRDFTMMPQAEIQLPILKAITN